MLLLGPLLVEVEVEVVAAGVHDVATQYWRKGSLHPPVVAVVGGQSCPTLGVVRILPP